MKIGIIGAMEEEVVIIKEKLSNLQAIQKGSSLFYTGQLSGVEVVLLQSGIGKVAASIGTALMIECYKPDFILNTGSAGGLQKQLVLGDVIISSEVTYHDADVTAFGYEKGQLPNQPVRYLSDPKLIAMANTILEKGELTAYTGLICTGDSFVCDAAKQAGIRNDFDGVIAVEMEAAAIAQTCHQFDVPFLVIRAISDVADQESPMTFEEFLPLAAKQSSAFVINFIEEIKTN